LIHKIAQVGLDIKHIRRSNRTGYKAGALKKVCLAPRENLLLWIFVPQKTGSIKPFLILRIQNWGCSNPLGTSKPQLFVLTKIQAFALDAHFTLEQVDEIQNCISSILMEPLACGESNVFWMRELGK
jgi:hypothetical protein